MCTPVCAGSSLGQNGEIGLWCLPTLFCAIPSFPPFPHYSWFSRIKKIFDDHLHSLLNKVRGAWTCQPLNHQSENHKHIYIRNAISGFITSVCAGTRWASLGPWRKMHVQEGKFQWFSLKQMNYCRKCS